MKTKEELAAIKEELCEIDKKLVELDEDELKAVTAGTAFTTGTYAYSTFIHDNCGGEIMHVGNPFVNCCCNKCGEEHYWHFSFDYTEVFED